MVAGGKAQQERDPRPHLGQIDEAGGVIRLSPACSKTLVGRILPISQPIAEALARRRARRDPVRLEFVVRPPLGSGPSPGSGRSNGHCSARHGPPCVRRKALLEGQRRRVTNGPFTHCRRRRAALRTSGILDGHWRPGQRTLQAPRWRRPRQAPRNGASILDSARELGIRDAQVIRAWTADRPSGCGPPGRTGRDRPVPP